MPYSWGIMAALSKKVPPELTRSFNLKVRIAEQPNSLMLSTTWSSALI